MNVNKIKKPLMISGPSGCGKSLITKIIIKPEFYNIFLINLLDFKNPKLISESISNFLKNKSIDSFFTSPKKKIIIIDELENIMSERGFPQEISSIIEHLSTKIHIILITNNTDKKIGELSKKCHDIRLMPPTKFEIDVLVSRICKDACIKLHDKTKQIIVNNAQSDYRCVIKLLFELYTRFPKQTIMPDKIEILSNSVLQKQIDYNLFEITNNIINKKNNISDVMRMYESDKLLLSLMIHENYIDCLTDIKGNVNKLKLIAYISDKMSLSETFEKNIYSNHYWELYIPAGINSCCFPSLFINKYQRDKIHKIRFTNYLSKSSTYASRKKNDISYHINIPCMIYLPTYLISNLITLSIFNDDPYYLKYIITNYKLMYDDLEKLFKLSSFSNIYKKRLNTKLKKKIKEYFDIYKDK